MASHDFTPNENMDSSKDTPSMEETIDAASVPWWRRMLGRKPETVEENNDSYRSKATLGILSDKYTDEVPGTVLLLSAERNEPLGMRHQPQRTSSSSLPTSNPPSRSSSRTRQPQKKRTADGQIVLEPQPDDSVNDPLNWPVWQRDAALVSLGFYCLMGGGMTPILAAGFNSVSKTYDVSVQRVAFTTGFYMLGLGLGSVVMSPTAILFGKRPVYLLGAILFVISGIWCALSPNYASLVIARIFQGVAVSPVECLPSATIAEIYFLHERAYRVGIYTLLLLGGKNIIPLISAAIIGSLGWRWVFWIVAIIVGFCLVLLFFFVPETFWDRTPRPRRKRPTAHRTVSDLVHSGLRGRPHVQIPEVSVGSSNEAVTPGTPRKSKHAHFGFAVEDTENEKQPSQDEADQITADAQSPGEIPPPLTPIAETTVEKGDNTSTQAHLAPKSSIDLEAGFSSRRSESVEPNPSIMSTTLHYTNRLRDQPKVPYLQLLRVWNGRITHDSWIKIAIRPFILFAYPSVLWSTVMYTLSVGWLIVISESVSTIYESKEKYGFTALQTGLIYISPFVGGLLGTAVAGKVSDVVVRYLTRRNGGVYEPEFRLVMAIPIALSTVIGLMGFGWSAEQMDAWIVPTVFFGLISFGCCLGSTTAITFCVDSYRQYAGEALVTLNFSKNVLHGLIWSLFIVDWLDADGSRTVFLSIGGIQLFFLFLTIPMYIYGKRARMWTVRKRLMERF
ncbi:hypothetical protein N7495_009087 [Penicillium taxi]|uniref:uncharacterized protein n=1 Tax=Penicillium taxi TaxID=168475 RepID=UPI0025459D15|nr:uncharacterized protein N7495_009087 [Penicillium taxi]KAJ5889046.1 hypothetical protein N7495_009087 [Penicillium taxi]